MWHILEWRIQWQPRTHSHARTHTHRELLIPFFEFVSAPLRFICAEPLAACERKPEESENLSARDGYWYWCFGDQVSPGQKFQNTGGLGFGVADVFILYCQHRAYGGTDGQLVWWMTPVRGEHKVSVFLCVCACVCVRFWTDANDRGHQINAVTAAM